MVQIKEKTEKLLEKTVALGRIGLLIIENESNVESIREEAVKSLIDFVCEQIADYVELMSALNAGKHKLFYAENSDKLNGSILEIIAEFEAGIVSLADRKNNSGLLTAKWNPTETSLTILMSRRQVENSYPRLFEYINIIQSL